MHIHQVVYWWDCLRCVAYGEQIHRKTQPTKLDYRIALCLVFEIVNFSGVELSISTSKVGIVSRTYRVEIIGVSKLRARDYLVSKDFHITVLEAHVGVCVEHSDSLTKGVFQERLEGVPVKKNKSLNFIHFKSNIDEFHTFLDCCTPTRKSHWQTACYYKDWAYAS